jgi:hypothetical protein
MKLSEFLDKTNVSGHYSTDRKLMSNNKEGEVICSIALIDDTQFYGYMANPHATSWAVIFRGSHRKTLYAFVDGRRVSDVRKVVDYIRKINFERELPTIEFEKELMLEDL